MTAALSEPGGAPERTGLAWTRTGLAVLVTGLLAARLVLARSTAGAAAAGGVAVLGAVLLVLLGRRRERRVLALLRAAGAGEPPVPADRLAAGLALAVVLVLSAVLAAPVLLG